jgi:hypothetical protein
MTLESNVLVSALAVPVFDHKPEPPGAVDP